MENSKTPFNNGAYIEKQTKLIEKRINDTGSRMYLEVGGKLFEDMHGSRVLPGFLPDNKMRILSHFTDRACVIVAVSADDIQSGKKKHDNGLSYAQDAVMTALRFSKLGIPLCGIAITRYKGQERAEKFSEMISEKGFRCIFNRFMRGYPTDTQLVVSEKGFGRNGFLETDRDLVIVTGPGPGSGKMETCLSQIYGEKKRGNTAGYSKFETFPVYDLELKHPLNLAYEAATADLGDVNMYDPFHLKAYGIKAVSYNRDTEAFPVLSALLTAVNGSCPYRSPTDMGINAVGRCIEDDEAVREASKQEILRRLDQCSDPREYERIKQIAQLI